MSEYRYELATLSPREIESTVELLRVVFPHAPHLTASYLTWMYAQNPAGGAVACNAWHGDKQVGHLAAVPFRAHVDGMEEGALLLQNSAIHPDHRGRRVQTFISEEVFAEAQRRGYAACLAVGNRYSTGPLLTRRFQMVRPLDARLGAGPLRAAREAVAPSFEAIWSDEAIAWRMANPRRRYSVRSGRLLAPTGWPGIGAILHEGLALADSGPQPPGPLRLFIGADPRIDFKRSAYVSIPRWLRPSPLNLVWRNLAGETAAPDPARFVLRPLDFDAY
ncbi:MAG TPA: GNAT family N-acetyltransferase [Allosphingosinicella sp.]